MIKWAFLAVSKAAEGQVHQSVIRIPEREITTVLVNDYRQAGQVAKELYASGVTMFELCAGFGHKGVAAVRQAVPEALVGVVRFDNHPALDGKSGDELFL